MGVEPRAKGPTVVQRQVFAQEYVGLSNSTARVGMNLPVAALAVRSNVELHAAGTAATAATITAATITAATITAATITAATITAATITAATITAATITAATIAAATITAATVAATITAATVAATITAAAVAATITAAGVAIVGLTVISAVFLVSGALKQRGRVQPLDCFCDIDG